MRSIPMLLRLAPQAANLNGAAFERRVDNASPALRQFYLLADLAVARRAVGSFAQADQSDNGGAIVSTSLGDSLGIAAGLGWYVTNRLRLDVIGEHRSSAQVRALDNLSATTTEPAHHRFMK